jgi:hypothetical protein
MVTTLTSCRLILRRRGGVVNEQLGSVTAGID